MKHTQGNWEQRHLKLHDKFAIYSEGGNFVASVGYSNNEYSNIKQDEAEANAKLICIAPEMLHQLICAEETIRKQGLTSFADAILITIKKATE